MNKLSQWSKDVKKINGVLGTKGGPERTNTASKEWCTSVKVELAKRDMTVNDLARAAGVMRDKMSCIINGKQWDEGIVAKIVETLGVEAPILAPVRKV
ncbi:MAG: helix-turn-helix domain-containing protein [Lachnospiraceae bacterium]|nr:helix-turn-helix domain-containing protein [Lachnospiraceae bacterium]